MIKLKDISARVRQIAIKNIGRDEPTLLITNDLTTAGKNLFARYAERIMVENELDAYIGGIPLEAVTLRDPLHAQLLVTLALVAGEPLTEHLRLQGRYDRLDALMLWRPDVA